MPHRLYAPPATFFERTRCEIAGILIPVIWTFALWTLKILPRLHPFRIFSEARIRESRELACRAIAIHNEGRLLPFQLPYLVFAYLVVDALSYRVKGPFDLIESWDLDERVHLLSRLADLARATPLF